MAKPARPELKFNNLDELVADVDQLRVGSYEKSGKWDLPMILDHLSKTMSSPFKSTNAKLIPWPIGPVVRYFFHLFAQQKHYPKIKLPAPGIFRPAVGMSLDAAYAELQDSTRLVQSANGPTVTCPPFGKIDLEDFRKMQLLHGAHHLSFLKTK